MLKRSFRALWLVFLLLKYVELCFRAGNCCLLACYNLYSSSTILVATIGCLPPVHPGNRSTRFSEQKWHLNQVSVSFVCGSGLSLWFMFSLQLFSCLYNFLTLFLWLSVPVQLIVFAYVVIKKDSVCTRGRADLRFHSCVVLCRMVKLNQKTLRLDCRKSSSLLRSRTLFRFSK